MIETIYSTDIMLKGADTSLVSFHGTYQPPRKSQITVDRRGSGFIPEAIGSWKLQVQEVSTEVLVRETYTTVRTTVTCTLLP